MRWLLSNESPQFNSVGSVRSLLQGSPLQGSPLQPITPSCDRDQWFGKTQIWSLLVWSHLWKNKKIKTKLKLPNHTHGSSKELLALLSFLAKHLIYGNSNVFRRNLHAEPSETQLWRHHCMFCIVWHSMPACVPTVTAEYTHSLYLWNIFPCWKNYNPPYNPLSISYRAMF